MSKHIGKKVGLLTVVSVTKGVSTCLCDCGKYHETMVTNVIRGLTKSCGCKRWEWMVAARNTHRKTGTPEHVTWVCMRGRCNNPNNGEFPRYGGRGIKVCERWNCFENFLADMGPKPSSKHSIERVNVNEGYCPENCIWIPKSEQAINRRNTTFVLIDGQRTFLSDAAKKAGTNAFKLKKKLLKEPSGSVVTRTGKRIQLLPKS